MYVMCMQMGWLLVSDVMLMLIGAEWYHMGTGWLIGR